VIRALFAKRLAMLLMLCAGGLCGVARAEPIQIGPSPGTEYFHDGVLVRPSSFEVNEFVSSVAGKVTISVQRIDWGDLFSQLSTTVSLFDRPDLVFNGNALTMFDVTAGERFTTSIFGQVARTGGFGAYRLDILFLPSGTQVPLPAGAWLLLSGLAALLIVARRGQKKTALAFA
jgi:hypothetical protein